MDETCPEEEIQNIKFKIVLLGDTGVGKSAICTQLCKSYFIQSYRETYGCDFYSKNYNLPNRNFVNLQIWDIGFLSLSTKMIENYLYGANFVLLVYDITKRETYEKILNLMKLANKYLGNHRVLFGLIGNKTDLYHLHAVKMAEHAQLSETYKMKSFFMSAKTGDQINDCFITIAGDLAGVNVNLKNNTVGNHQVNNQQVPDNIEEDEDDDDSDDSEAENKRKKSEKTLKNENSNKKSNNNLNKNVRDDTKDGFSMSQADLKKVGGFKSTKQTKKCLIF